MRIVEIGFGLLPVLSVQRLAQWVLGRVQPECVVGRFLFAFQGLKKLHRLPPQL